MTSKVAQYSTLSGLLAVILVIVSFLIEGDTPDLDASTSDVVAF